LFCIIEAECERDAPNPNLALVFGVLATICGGANLLLLLEADIVGAFPASIMNCLDLEAAPPLRDGAGPKLD